MPLHIFPHKNKKTMEVLDPKLLFLAAAIIAFFIYNGVKKYFRRQNIQRYVNAMRWHNKTLYLSLDNNSEHPEWKFNTGSRRGVFHNGKTVLSFSQQVEFSGRYITYPTYDEYGFESLNIHSEADIAVFKVVSIVYPDGTQYGFEKTANSINIEDYLFYVVENK